MARVAYDSNEGEASQLEPPDIEVLFPEPSADPSDLFPYGDRMPDEKQMIREPRTPHRRVSHPPPFEGLRFPLGGPRT